MRRERTDAGLRYLCVGLMLVALLGGLTARVAASPPPVTLAGRVSFGTYPYPQKVVAADFNGDGKPDLATANAVNSGPASVLLNTTATGATTPSFATHVDFATGTYPASIAVGDFNGDGKPDIVTANQTGGSVSVLLNTTATNATTPTFTTHVDFAAGSQPFDVAVGDFNGDGKPDIAVADFGGGVSVLLNTTAAGASVPTFATAVSFTAGTQPTGVAVGDLNGDGKLDLAVANYGSGTLSVLLNTTAVGASVVTFATHVEYTVGTHPFSVAVGDLNGDGKLDTAVANYGSGSVSVLLGNGAGGFPTKTDYPAPNTEDVKIADMNGDGLPDLVVSDAATTNQVGVLLNTGAGVFATRVAFGTDLNPSGVAIADVNGDGKPDVITADLDSSGNVDVLLNTSGLTATTSVGNGQSIAAGANATALTVHVTDGTGAAVSGVQVTFTAPTTGPRGTFAGGANTATATTDSSGNATAPTFTAGTVTGSFTLAVTATMTGTFSGTTAFTLTVTPGAAASVTVVAGNNQTPTVNTALSTALQAKVTDSYGNVRAGDTVTFTVNAMAGAGATFAGGATTATATTNSSGIATAPTLTANTVAGGYTVTATDGAATSASFALTNVAGSAVGLTLSGLTNGAAGTAQSVTVKAVDQYGNTATSYTGPVTFTSSDAQAVLPGSTTLTNGAATVSVTLKTAGTQTVTAMGSGVTSAQSSVTVTAAAAAGLTLTGLANGVAGTVQTVTVKAVDAYGNIVTSSASPVAFTSSDRQAALPTGVILTNGIAMASVTLKTAGTQTITATGNGGITGQASATVTVGSAAHLVTTGGSAHGTTPGNAFLGGNLAVQVTDSYGNIRVGDTVTFTVNAMGGAGATFAGGATTATATTGDDGVANAPTLTANSTPGSYTATASVMGVGETASFALTNGTVNATPAPRVTAAAAMNTPNVAPTPHAAGTPAGSVPAPATRAALSTPHASPRSPCPAVAGRGSGEGTFKTITMFLIRRAPTPCPLPLPCLRLQERGRRVSPPPCPRIPTCESP